MRGSIDMKKIVVFPFFKKKTHPERETEKEWKDNRKKRLIGAIEKELSLNIFFYRPKANVYLVEIHDKTTTKTPSYIFVLKMNVEQRIQHLCSTLLVRINRRSIDWILYLNTYG